MNLHRILPLLFSLLLVALSPLSEARVTTSTTVEQAKDRAAKSKKDYLVFNYGEWDPYSSEIYKSCWKSTRHLDKTLEPSTILAEATFGDNLTDAQKKAQERKNKGLDKTPPCLPSVFFFDQDGFHYGTLTGSAVPRDGMQFAEAVAEIQKKRIKRDEIIKEAQLKRGVERAKIIGSAADIEGIKVSPKILEMIKAADPRDQSGYIRRLTFDIFKFHDVLKESEEKAFKEMDKVINDEGYSVEQRQMVLGLKNFVYRKNPGENAKLIADNYRKMYELGPDTIIGKSGLKGLQESFDFASVAIKARDLPIDEAVKYVDTVLEDDSFPYSTEQKQDLIELQARCMAKEKDKYKDAIVAKYKKIIEMTPDSDMAEFAQQEIDFLTLSPEELEKRERKSLDEMYDRDKILGEEVYPDDDDFE